MTSQVFESSLLTPAGRKAAEAVFVGKDVGMERLLNLLGEMQEQLQQLRDNSAVITDEELYDFWIETSPTFGCADPVGFARAVLARWGNP
jgi:hypothetical protein